MEDFLYKFLSLYQALPFPVKRLVGWFYNGLPLRLKYGKYYEKYSTRISEFQCFTNTELCVAEQEKLLFEQLNIAFEKVPAYMNYPKVTDMANFRKLPIITKSSIVNEADQFINPALFNKRIKANTGGSSGTPMEFFIEKDVSRPKEKAHFDWYWGQFSYNVDDRILMVRGTPLHRNRSYEYSPIGNTLNVSCYNINDGNIESILKRINKFKPRFIHAYPSSLKIITSLLEKHKHMINFKVDALFLGSEHLIKADREYFSEFYGGNVVSWYGHSERLIHGGNCPFSDEFHFFPFYGLMELLDENDEPVSQPNVEGRIVATGYDNSVMPFIRYDTGDRGVLSEVSECKCGFRGITLKEIAGRGQDIIVLSDNTRVTLTAFIYGQHLEAFRKIREIQVVQERKGEIEIRIVKNASFTPSDARIMISTLSDSVEHKLKIRLEYVDHLSKTGRGKSRFLISYLQHET